MTTIFKSVIMVMAIAAVVGGATTAYFSDTETSANNTFTAGTLDLKVGNTAYYNGNVVGALGWTLSDLGVTSVFQNFTNVKPGDYGYNTVPVKVEGGDAWVRVKLSKTSDEDVDCTNPESKVTIAQDPQCGIGGTGTPGNGELDEAIFSLVWVDTNEDGVKDASEQLLMASNSNIDTGWSTGDDKLAELWNYPNIPGVGGDKQFIDGIEYKLALGWCVGLPTGVIPGQTGLANTAALQVASIDLSTCSGAMIDNRSQSDTLVSTVTIEAVQYENNPSQVF